MGAFLLSAGRAGKRLALPNARILIHQPSTDGGAVRRPTIEIQAKEIIFLKARMNHLMSKHTGRAG